jgi:hypothetical protein
MPVRLDPYILSCSRCLIRAWYSSWALHIYVSTVQLQWSIIPHHYEECSSGVTVSYVSSFLWNLNALTQNKYTNKWRALHRLMSLPPTGREIMNCSGDLHLLHPVWLVLLLLHQEISFFISTQLLSSSWKWAAAITFGNSLLSRRLPYT